MLASQHGCKLHSAGFEHSVNAEQGSMGAGAGAAATIDHDTPPRGTAIEKVQAELRRDLAVREERRRELEFLEKGGEPLDFKFGKVPSLTFSFPSAAEPLANNLLSEGEGGSAPNAIANGNPTENISSQGVSGGVEPDECSFLVDTRDATDHAIPSKGESPQPGCSTSDSVQTQVDLTTKRESESPGGGCVGSKDPAYLKRNRHWSQHLGNGHLSVKEQEKVVGVNSSLVEVETKENPVPIKDESMLDMGFQMLPHQSPHAASGKWNGGTTNQELEPVIGVMTRCGAVLEQHAADVSTDIGKGSNRTVLRSHLPLKSGVDLSVDTGKKDGLPLAGKESNIGLFFSEDKPNPHVQSFCELGEVVAAGLQGFVGDKSALGRISVNPGRARDEDTATGHSEHRTSKLEAQERVGTAPLINSSSIENGSGRTHKEVSQGGPNSPPRSCLNEQNLSSKEVTGADGKSGPAAELILKGVEGVSIQKSLMINKGLVRGSNNIRQAKRDWSAQDDKRLSASNARIKVENVVAEDRAKPSAAEAEVSCSQMSDVPRPQKLRTEGQAGASVGRISMTIGRTSSSSALLKNKFPGLVIPWEKEVNPTVQAEAEKHRADISAKARKACEDIILEEAEHLQVSVARKSTVDQALKKPWPEDSRRKAHWDFVLEEMAWLANDFMQESLWKRAAAAQVCRCVALIRRQDDFLASELSTRQRKVAKVLADAVSGFWHSIEAADMGTDNVDKKKSMVIQQYAMRFLKSSGFELMVQAEAPATPERHSESSSTILEPFWEDQFPEELLFYVVPHGAMEVYRASAESDRATLEKCELELASDAEVHTIHDAAEDAAVNCDFGVGDHADDRGSQDDYPQLHFMPHSVGSGGGLPGIAKKKRKKILKVNTAIPKVEPGGPLSGFVYEPSMSGGDLGLPSPVVTGKRSLSGHTGSSSLPGIIPTKRARSSAANLRQRPAVASTSPGTLGLSPRTTVSSHCKQDKGMDMLDGSNRADINSDTPSNSLHAVGNKGTFVPSKSKKKKNFKHSLGDTSASRQADDGVSGSTTVKVPMTFVIFLPDTSETPGPGVKKSKIVKQSSDGNTEAISDPIQPASQTGQQSVVLGGNKMMRQNSNRDRNNPKSKSSKGSPLNTPTGIGIPWSSVEDQAILVLVHDLGPNWELVSDVLSYNSQLKGIYRKPMLCRERHKFLSERLGTEIQENSDDFSPVQLSNAPPTGIPKGNNTRTLLQRIHGAVEEDTLKVHLEQICLTWEKFRPQKATDVQEQKVLTTPHPSHGIAISQFCNGDTPNPLDLCDRVMANGEIPPHSFAMQASAHGNGPGFPSGGLPPGSSLRPPSSGMPPGLPGSNGLLPGHPVASSSASINAAAARDAQHLPAMRLTSEETNQLRMATAGPVGAYNQRLQQQAVSATAGLPVLGSLPNSNDLPLLPTSTTAGMLIGLNRTMSLPRPGLPGLGLAAVSNMGSVGLGTMLPPSGVNMGSSATFPSCSISGHFMAHKTRDNLHQFRMDTCPEEQRMQLIKQLQHHALQGDTQAAAALTSLGSDMVSSPPQSFSPQHQHQQQQQQQQQAQAFQALFAQDTLPRTFTPPPRDSQQQAWQLQAAHLKEQQRQLQQQQRLLGALPTLPQPQHQQLLAPHQPYMPNLSSQHMGLQSQHIISQQSQNLQKQLGQQQQQQVATASEVAQCSLPSSSLQSAPVSPAGSGSSSLNSQQQQCLPQQNQAPGQMPQIPGPAKLGQAKQFQKHQQQQTSRVSKGVSRGPMMMQGLSQSNNLPANVNIGGKEMPGELPGQTGGHPLQQGQRVLQPQGQIQSGKLQAWSQQGIAGQKPQLQSQGAQLQGGAQSQGLAYIAGQQKGHQQQQGAQVLASKQQQSQQQAASSQQQTQRTPSPQQAQAQQQLPLSAQISQPQLQPPTPCQQQQQQQSQQNQRWPMQQQQEPPHQRRSVSLKLPKLQTWHPGTAIGMPMPGQLGKAGMQQQGQVVSPQMASQPASPAYQLGTTSSTGTPMSMSSSSPQVMPISSGLKSTTVNSSHWKSNQAAPSTPGGMFNLAHTSSPGLAHVPPMVGPSGVHMPSSNGNTGLPIHGASSSGLPPAHAVMRNAPGQKFAVGPGPHGRENTGSQQGVTVEQWSHQGSSTPVSFAMSNMAASQTRLPVQSSSPGMLPGSMMGLVTSGPPNVTTDKGPPPAGPSHRASIPGSGLLYSMQPQQPPVGNVTSTVTAVSRRSPSPASSGPVPAAAISPMGSTPPSLVMPAGAAAPSSSSP
ncbi:unnamed protein product [Sphagnum jensenii]|uniref:Uncharacterized protein n=1 Tax=Sphagnum jensenii TaxID=128206 RepID=A0ABP0VSC7_9BRYO